MKTIPLYKYNREDGGTCILPSKVTDYVDGGVRLVADSGKLLTNGTIVVSVIDTTSADGWTEIIDPNA